MRLWHRLRPMRRDGLAFRRQSPVGRYVLDFECRLARIAIELDGTQHGDPERAQADAKRTHWLESRGYQVLRFWNHDVIFQTDAVVFEIITAAQMRLEEFARFGRD